MEDCDDGNTIAGDSCSDTCTLEGGPTGKDSGCGCLSATPVGSGVFWLLFVLGVLWIRRRRRR